MKLGNFNYSLMRFFSSLFLLTSIISLTLGGMGCSDKPISFADRMTNLVPSQGTLSPEFSTLVLLYDLTVDNTTESISFTPTLEGNNVSVTVEDVAVESGSSSQQVLLTGERTEIRVDVVSETVDYNYVITVIKARSANAFLSDLILSEGQLEPSFVANEVSFEGYDVTVPYSSLSISLTATLADVNASLTINGATESSGEATDNISLIEGTNIINIVVTAQNNIMTQTYQLNVIRSSAEVFAYSTYIKANNTDPEDQFAQSISMWGDTLVVGAPDEDSFGSSSNGNPDDNSASDIGAVYVYEKNVEQTWDFQSYLKPSSPEITQLFGRKIAISNNRIVVALNNLGSDGTPGGRIEEFIKNESGLWTRGAAESTPNILPSIEPYLFGTDIALSNKFTIIGFPGEQGSTTGINGLRGIPFESVTNPTAGAVYVYTNNDRRPSFYELDSYIKASNTGSFDLFGYSIALSGNTLAVGAPGEDSNATGINGEQSDNSSPAAGAVYIFTYDNDTGWSQQAYIKASNPKEDDQFGFAVALSGDTLVVGAPGQDDRTGEDGLGLQSGAAYVFTRDSSSNWSQQAYLKPTPFVNQDTSNGNAFGSDLLISGDTIVVTSPTSSAGGTGISESQTRIDDETIANSFSSGSANIFTRESNLWTEVSYIKAPNTNQSDKFGSSIAGYGHSLVFAAPFEDSNATFNTGGESDNSSENAGAAFIYHNAPFSNHNLALTVIANTDGRGSIQGINQDTGIALTECLNDCSQLVDRNQTIQLIPVPENGASQFDYWEGDLACLVEPEENGAIFVRILAETYCKAVFSEKEIRLTVSKDVSSTATGTIEATSNGEAVVSCDFECDTNTSETLDLSATIQITATAEDGAFVAAWSGDAECQNNATNLNTVTTVTMDKSKTCTALFSFPDTNTLRLTVDNFDGASGSISATNLNTSEVLEGCSSDCSQQVIQGHNVQLIANTENDISEFLAWNGDDECLDNANGAETSVNLSADKLCTATFGEIVVEDILLTINKDATSTADGLVEAFDVDSVVVASCDVGCTTDTSSALDLDSIITLTATPEAGAEVTAWTGDAECQANANDDNTATSVSMSASKTCSAQFDLLGDSTLRFIVANSGGSLGIINATNTDTGESYTNCTTDCTEQVTNGQTVSLLASPTNASSQFVNWSGDPACTANINPADTTNVLVNADTTCTANFEPVDSGTINITISKADDQTGDGNIDAILFDAPLVSCPAGCTSATSAEVDPDSFILLFATPDSLSVFVEWSGDAECTTNAMGTQTNVTLDVAKTCTAKFDTLPAKTN